jgi:beta-galactosidase/beta-glucuronidase
LFCELMNDSPNGLPRPEYPRPQFTRPMWMNLNGEWEFAFDDLNNGASRGWALGASLDRRIIVPFPYQSKLSDIDDKSVHETIWYARNFDIPLEWLGMNVLLHFGAVDFECTIWINGREVGHNRGGQSPFYFNIAPYLNVGSNRLTVCVHDTQSGAQPRGKQSMTGQPHDIDYYCTSGIWQTVWLEPVPAIRIEDVRMQSSAALATVDLTVFLHAPSSCWTIHTEIWDDNTLVIASRAEANSATVRQVLQIPQPKPWSPDSPHLYDLKIRLLRNGEVLDEIGTYTGLRDFELRSGTCHLNGEPLYLQMVLDQGYWQDGLLAAPCDESLRADVLAAKAFGFNGVRKHQKIEDPRWLYWCDHLGLMVWEEMPNAREWSTQAEELLAGEWRRVVQRDFNHPCIIAWVPVNESMGFPGLKESHPGQYAFIERMVGITREVDPLRPVIDNDGWEHSDITDICAIHDYTPTAHLLRERYQEATRGGDLPAHMWLEGKPLFVLGARYRGQPIVLSEVGGFLRVPDNIPPANRDMLFQFYGSWHYPAEFVAKYRDLMEGIASLRFVAGFCYTQLADIEQETNGLLTYSREPKIDPAEICRINKRILENVDIRRSPADIGSNKTQAQS